MMMITVSSFSEQTRSICLKHNYNFATCCDFGIETENGRRFQFVGQVERITTTTILERETFGYFFVYIDSLRHTMVFGRKSSQPLPLESQFVLVTLKTWSRKQTTKVVTETGVELEYSFQVSRSKSHSSSSSSSVAAAAKSLVFFFHFHKVAAVAIVVVMKQPLVSNTSSRQQKTSL